MVAKLKLKGHVRLFADPRILSHSFDDPQIVSPKFLKS